MSAQTGDIRNNFEKLRRSLVKIKYDQLFSPDRILQGDTLELLPILHYVLLGCSPLLARYLLDQGHVLSSKSDLAFVEGVYRVCRRVFQYNPKLSTAQFLTASGFAERKIIFVQQIIRLSMAKHNELCREAGAEGAEGSTDKQQRASSQKSTSSSRRKSSRKGKSGKCPAARVVRTAQPAAPRLPAPTPRPVQHLPPQEPQPAHGYSDEFTPAAAAASYYGLPEDQGGIDQRVVPLEDRHAWLTEFEQQSDEAVHNMAAGAASQMPLAHAPIVPSRKPAIVAGGGGGGAAASSAEQQPIVEAVASQVVELLSAQLMALSSKVQTFQDKLLPAVDNVAARLTLLEGKVNFLQGKVEKIEAANTANKHASAGTPIFARAAFGAGTPDAAPGPSTMYGQRSTGRKKQLPGGSSPDVEVEVESKDSEHGVPSKSTAAIAVASPAVDVSTHNGPPAASALYTSTMISVASPEANAVRRVRMQQDALDGGAADVAVEDEEEDDSGDSSQFVQALAARMRQTEALLRGSNTGAVAAAAGR